MIRSEDIERKDFSETIPELADKVLAIGSALMTYGYSDDSVMEADQCKGFGFFLCEINDDLMKIYNALYGDGRLPIFPKEKGVDG